MRSLFLLLIHAIGALCMPRTAIPNEYVVLLQPGISTSLHLAWLTEQIGELAARTGDARYRVLDVLESDEAGAYLVKGDEALASIIRENPSVRYLEENMVYSVAGEQREPPSWGLARISERIKGKRGSYWYSDTAGRGVDAYIIDTGVNVKHRDFGGRAVWGTTVPQGETDDDGQGHGTHVASTVAGDRYGVAKGATIVAVKVLKDDGSGSLFDVIKGIDWAAKRRSETKRPSIANMSLGGPKSFILDIFVVMAVKRGLQFAVAAGNSNEDACGFSPASADGVISVGASNVDDERAFFSNYGECVSLFAPGLNITGAWIGSDSAEKTISGTSMASPHVCGVAALVLGAKGDMAPEALKSEIVAMATGNALDEDKLGEKSPNLLLFNGGEKLGKTPIHTEMMSKVDTEMIHSEDVVKKENGVLGGYKWSMERPIGAIGQPVGYPVQVFF